MTLRALLLSFTPTRAEDAGVGLSAKGWYTWEAGGHRAFQAAIRRRQVIGSKVVFVATIRFLTRRYSVTGPRNVSSAAEDIYGRKVLD